MPPASRRAQNRGIALLEQRNQQVLGTDVVMAVIAALLLGDAKHAPRCRAKFREQAGSGFGFGQDGKSGRFRGDWI